jgi:hypothetical protein
MDITSATATATRIIGKNIRYAKSKASSLHTDDYRNFTILEIEKIDKALKTGIWYFVAKVIDHDDQDAEKVRSLHFEGIV